MKNLLLKTCLTVLVICDAAAGIAASAHAPNIHTGVTTTEGAVVDVYKVNAGAIPDHEALRAWANMDITGAENIHNTTNMAAAIARIGLAQDALSTLIDTKVSDTYSLSTVMGGFVSLEPGVHKGSAISLAANSTVEFFVNNSPGVPMNHVWVINLSEALTVGAGTVFKTNIPNNHTATIIWNVGTTVTLGAGTQFLGSAFVGSAFGAATSDVGCGNIYATGAVSVGNIGAVEDGLDGTTIDEPVACDTNADNMPKFTISENEYSFGIEYAVSGSGPADGIVLLTKHNGTQGIKVTPMNTENGRAIIYFETKANKEIFSYKKFRRNTYYPR